jgi:diguanylate cyclase (GGDEF)-like protein
VVLLPATDAAGARQVAENIRLAVEELEIPHERSKTSPIVTVSLGVHSCVPRREDSAERALAAADERLYEAKRSGRNRVCG